MRPSPQVLIYEFISAGGLPVQELPSSLVMEALAMLWSTLADFQRWGAMRTAAVLDPRLEGFIPGLDSKTLPCDRVICPSRDAPQAAFAQLLEESDAALIIAPETGGELARLSGAVLAAGVHLLGSFPEAIVAAGDKAECARRWRFAGLPIPRTRIVPFSAARHAVENFGYPLVVKPSDGVGCAGVSLVGCPDEIDKALEELAAASRCQKIVLQSYVSGIHASLSLLAAGDRVVPLSLNSQQIEPGLPFVYQGGQIPLMHPLAGRACEIAGEALKAIPGLQGYVGVDLVLSDTEAWLIEINPRLTTAYIGLRQVYPSNLAQAIWDACSSGRLSEAKPLGGQVTFHPRDPQTWFNQPPGRPADGT